MARGLPLGYIHLIVVFAVLLVFNILRNAILLVYGLFPFPSWLDAWFNRSNQLQKAFNFHLGKDARTSQIRDLIQCQQLKLEEHFAVTEDGFVLVLHRLVVVDPTTARSPIKSRSSSISSDHDKPELSISPKPAVLLMHGLMQDSESFICAGDNSLGVMLAKAGFDVWLGNNRGNRYSHKHLRLTPGDDKYWDFCIDDLARIDVPTMLAYIKRATRRDHVAYVGLSQGTAQAFAAFAWNPQLSESVPIFIALAPAVRAKGLTPSILASLISANLEFINVLFGSRSMLGYVTTWQRILTPQVFMKGVSLSMTYLFGWNCATISPERRETLFQHVYSYSSVKCVSHWFQLIRHGKLAMFQDKYSTGSRPPLNYDIAAIRCPIALFYGEEDKLVDARAVAKELGPHLVVKDHCQARYEHLDMLWADNAHEEIFPEVIRLLQEYAFDASNEVDIPSPIQLSS